MCSPSAPTQQQMATTELPEWARPYAQKALAKTEALTETPLAKYTEPRIAGFSPLQQAAMSTVESPETYGRSIGAFMSPYMQNVVDVQKREAARQSAMMGTQQQAQATGAGAFGGYREALQRAERERNLGQQMNDIQTRGLEAAYQGAQGTLGNFLGLQSQYGAQQQALRQQGLSQAYQDFMNEQNYPYKQLGFMSDMIRGLPLGQQSTSQIYQAPPTALQTVGSLGLGAYGLKQLGMFADGGMVGYADGGSVTDEEFVKGALDKLSDTQLAQAERIAIMTNDQQRLDDIAEEKATRASERGGMAGAYNALPSEYQDSIVRAANGGIVAFANGGIQRYNQKGYVLSDTPGFVEGEDSDMQIPVEDLLAGRDDESPGNAGLQADFANMFRTRLNRMEADQGYVPMTRAQRRAAEKEAYQEFVNAAGPDIYQPAIQRLGEADAARGQAMQEAKGLGALQAMQAITQPGGFIRGLGGAGAAFGATMAKAKEADRAEKRYINQMQLSLADAKRKEALGLFKEARADVQASEIAGLNASKARQLRDTNILNALGRGMQATRPAAQKAPPGEKEFQFGVSQYLPMVKEQFPDLSPAQQNAKAFQMYQERKSAGLAGVETRVEASAEEKARERAAKRASGDSQVLTAIRKKDTAAEAARRAAILQEELSKPVPGAGAGQTGGITPEAFNKKWATLKSGESLVGPDGKTYTKK